MTIATVLRSGGLYTAAWVTALSVGVGENMPSEYRFVCLSDVEVPGVETVELEHNWPGWWSKVEVFRLGGPVLYLDLDTLPVDDMTDLCSYRGPLAVLRDLYSPAKFIGSGVMAFTGGSHTEAIYEAFRADPVGIMKAHRTRSDHWYHKVMGDDVDRLQDLFPGQIVSFKKDARRKVPNGASLVAGHGNPRFSNPEAGWAHELWKERASGVSERAA